MALLRCFFLLTLVTSNRASDGGLDNIANMIHNYFNSTSTMTTTTLTFTLGIVLSNPNMTEALMRQVLMASEQRIESAPLPPLHSPFFQSHPSLIGRLHAYNYRLQINPVNVHGMGLNRLLKTLFCSRSAQGTNALFILVDKSASRNSQTAQLTSMLAMMARYVNLPVIAWSSSASELRGLPTSDDFQNSNNELPINVPSESMETLLLAPSIRSQARAIYAFLKQYFGDRKVTIIASVRQPGHEIFVNEIRSIAEVEDKRHSLFEFDSHQYHMSSRVIQVLKVDAEFLLSENMRHELTSIRDHTETKAFVLFANQADNDKILEEAHHLGMTTSDYVWLVGKPGLGDLSENTAIPINYVPGLIAVTYNTSLNAQLVALKTAVQIWSDGFKKFLHLAKAVGSNNAHQNSVGPYYYYHKTGTSLQAIQQAQQQLLSPIISCNNSAQQRWANGNLFHRTIKHRLAKLLLSSNQNITPSSSKSSPNQIDGLAGLSDIIFLELQFNRLWRKIGGWTQQNNAAVVDDVKWLQGQERLRHINDGKHNIVRIATLEEPPYVVYEFPDEATGECDRKAIPCRLSPLAYVRASDFKDDAHRHVHVSTVPDDHDHHRNGSLMCCAGFSMDLLKRLSQDIGFNFELFEVRDRKWGAPDKATGQWNGLVQALLDGSADMVVTSLKINSDRNSVIDFSIPFFETGITILVRVREGMVSAVAFLEPFSEQVWLVIFFGCVNAFALLTFIFEFLLHRITILTKDHDESNRFSLAESFWMILSMLFNSTGSIKQPQCSSSRFITTLWSFTCIILVASFMANLAAFMITKDDYYDFTGVDDYRLKNPYTKNPAWRYATIPSGATETIIRSNFPDMYEYMRTFTRPNADAGVEAVRKGELDAFIYDASVLEYKVGRDKNCALRTVGKWYALTGYGVALPKNSKWLHAINKFIVEYQRSGFLQNLEGYWLASACKERQNSEMRKSHALGILNLKAVFVILGSSIVGCGLFLVFEHIFMRHCRRFVGRIDKCGCFAAISPKMGAALSFKAAVERALSETRRSRHSSHPSSFNSHRSPSQRSAHSFHNIQAGSLKSPVFSIGTPVHSHILLRHQISTATTAECQRTAMKVKLEPSRSPQPASHQQHSINNNNNLMQQSIVSEVSNILVNLR